MSYVIIIIGIIFICLGEGTAEEGGTKLHNLLSSMVRWLSSNFSGRNSGKKNNFCWYFRPKPGNFSAHYLFYRLPSTDIIHYEKGPIPRQILPGILYPIHWRKVCKYHSIAAYKNLEKVRFC